MKGFDDQITVPYFFAFIFSSSTLLTDTCADVKAHNSHFQLLQKSRQPCYALVIQAILIPDCKSSSLHCLS